jgi:hypothetical protein
VKRKTEPIAAPQTSDDEKSVPVVVTMRVKCGCGHAEDETYEFDMPADQAKPMEAYEPGTCPVCRAPIRVYLRRVSALQ